MGPTKAKKRREKGPTQVEMKIQIKIKKFTGPTRALIRPCVMISYTNFSKCRLKRRRSTTNGFDVKLC
jgi:hypothetical protein